MTTRSVLRSPRGGRSLAVFDGLIIQWLLEPQRLPSGQLIADTLQCAATLKPADSTLLRSH